MTNYRVSPEEPNLRYYEQGAVIIAEGEENDGTIFILNEGKLGVYKGIRKVAEIEGNGVFVGEMAVIMNEPRTATVKALTPCAVMAYTGGVSVILKKLPAVAEKLFSTLASRIEKTEGECERLATRMEKLMKENHRMNQEIIKLNAKQRSLKEQIEAVKNQIEDLKNVKIEIKNKAEESADEEKRRGGKKRRWLFFGRG
ncbi:TPA: cyclic nucleotide-binding domain-containing protein [Candidatus Poribacteria bacterium]|nr:cyclic nucleotide-binding domain-containing protein [Candidatus Poribacteria bacterium]